jgi:DNA-binding HxlR family transcriptional regulator
MIQLIACQIREGNSSLAELAEGVGLSQEQLKNRLDLMERQGYIARETDCAPEGGCGCCHSCPSYGSGSRRTMSVRYRLTEKGQRLAGVSRVSG